MTTDQTTPQLNELFAALAKAQGQMKPAIKDSANPFFKSKYADLTSVWDACREALASNGISIVQFPVTEGDLVGVRTILGHASGQFLESVCWTKPDKSGPQALGSVTSYLRRYAVAAAAGVVTEDDDGESAHGRGAEGKADRVAPKASADPKAPAAAVATAEKTRAADTQPTEASGPKPPAVHYEHDPVTMAKATRLLQQLGWAKPHAVNWLKKHFQADSFAKLTAEQSVTAVEKLEMEVEAALAEEERKAAEATKGQTK